MSENQERLNNESVELDFNTDKIIDTIREIQQESKKDRYKTMNYATKYCEIAALYDEFETAYPTLFKRVIENQDLRTLAVYIYYLEKIKRKEISIEKAEEELGEYLKVRFLDPALKNAKRNE
jgi:hypothetical protein